MKNNNWLTGLLILTMPISLIYFLGSQMANGQVQRRYETYSAIPEHASVAQLRAQSEGDTVLLRGQIVALDGTQSAGPLHIYQERPLDGREVRFREEFPQVVPEFALALIDGRVVVQPAGEGERTISHETHRVSVGDRELTGFQIGDTVTVQGKWQPTGEGREIRQVLTVTGISGVEKAVLLAEVQASLEQVRLVRNSLGLLTLVSVVLLVAQLYRRRQTRLQTQSDECIAEQHDVQEEKRAWHLPTTETEPTT